MVIAVTCPIRPYLAVTQRCLPLPQDFQLAFQIKLTHLCHLHRSRCTRVPMIAPASAAMDCKLNYSVAEVRVKMCWVAAQPKSKVLCVIPFQLM